MKYTIDLPERFLRLYVLEELRPPEGPTAALREVTQLLFRVEEELPPVAEQPAPPPPPAPEPEPKPPSPPAPEPEPPNLGGWPVLTPVDQIAVGRPVRWQEPISRELHEFVPDRVVRGETITPTNRFGMALNGEAGRDLSRTVFIGCTIVGGRYAVYFEGETDVLFVGCTLDASPPAPAGLNEEAIVRLQNVERIGFFGCRLLDSTGPKHAFRVHKRARNVVLCQSEIFTMGNGFYIGTYDGQDDRSDVDGVELYNVRATIQGPDKFNTGKPPVAGDVKNLRRLNLFIATAQGST